MQRYGAKTNKGHKITWAESLAIARAKLESHGLIVYSVFPEDLEETLKRYGLEL